MIVQRPCLPDPVTWQQAQIIQNHFSCPLHQTTWPLRGCEIRCRRPLVGQTSVARQVDLWTMMCLNPKLSLCHGLWLSSCFMGWVVLGRSSHYMLQFISRGYCAEYLQCGVWTCCNILGIQVVLEVGVTTWYTLDRRPWAELHFLHFQHEDELKSPASSNSGNLCFVPFFSVLQQVI